MTLAMPDSVTPGNIPMGFPAYLGYVDGLFKTAPRLPELFPGATVVSLTVLGSTLSADGIDCEPGNVSAHRAAVWVHDKLEAEPGSRPVVYADLESPGFSMSEVIAELVNLGVSRVKYRVLTAHYDGEHVCSPARGCKDKDGNVITFTADGTQWTDEFPGVGGAAIDMSVLADDFFGSTGSTQPDQTEKILMQLPVVKQGQSGPVVRTIQGLCCARGHGVAVDGVFGPATLAAVKGIQSAAGVTADGVAGPVTWRALLGV